MLSQMPLLSLPSSAYFTLQVLLVSPKVLSLALLSMTLWAPVTSYFRCSRRHQVPSLVLRLLALWLYFVSVTVLSQALVVARLNLL